MRKYLEFIKAQIQVNTAYSAWYWAGSFATIVYLLIIYYFWHAVYANKSTIANMSLDSMITYAVIAMLLGQYVMGVGEQLAREIKEGNVAIELMRPYDLLWKMVALDLGIKFTELVRNTVPLLLVAFVFLGVQGPADWMAGSLFVLSAVLGILIGTQLDLIVGVLAFWTVNVWGLQVLRSAVIMFFTGSMIPISLFPEWLQTLSQYLPFQSMVFIPVSIYTGTLSGTEIWQAIGLQLFWLLLIYSLVRGLWSIALRKVTIFGG